MIKKINKIKDFGVFHNFSWSADINEFKTFNLLYGWNYSGKTTLSRVFRCLELGTLHPDYPTATFDLEDTAGTHYDQQFINPPLIRVFNSDFCRKNLQWDTESMEPIFMLGEDNAELQQQLKDKKKAIDEAEANLALGISTTSDKENAMYAKLTDKARTVGGAYGWRTFNRNHLRDYVVETANDVPGYTLSAEDFEKYKTQALSTEQKPILQKIEFGVLNIDTAKTEVEEILQRQITAKIIQELQDNKALGDWVDTGRDLHIERSDCAFCGNAITPERIDVLNAHFSKDYDKLKTDGNSKHEALKAGIIKLPLPAETALYADLQGEYLTAKTTLEHEVELYNNSIGSLLTDLKRKADKPFEKLDGTLLTDNTVAFTQALELINEVIEKNNKRTEEFDKEKESAIDLLKYHFAAEFETTEKYTATVAEVAKEREDHTTARGTIATLKNEHLQIENQLSETVKGAEKVNTYLKIFFGKDDLRIEATADNKFRLLRGGNAARNLSDGEKTAISLAYFIAKLEEKNTVLADTIVYIDDPVSSLDSNHLFNIYACIKTTFWDMSVTPIVCKCKQLFVSTHNFEFYTLMRMIPREKRDKGDKKIYNLRSIYLVERTANASGSASNIKNLPAYLESYKSEYIYLFSLLSTFLTSGAGQDFEQLYNLPNIMRRFLEVYLNFKFLTFGAIEETIGEVIKNPNDCEKVRKFVHYYSHGFSVSKLITYPDMAECMSVVQILLDAIKADDPTHYQSLMDEVSPPAQAAPAAPVQA